MLIPYVLANQSTLDRVILEENKNNYKFLYPGWFANDDDPKNIHLFIP